MAEAAVTAGFLPTLTARLRQFSPGSDIGLALGVVALLSVLVLPLPPLLLDFGLSLSLTAAVLVLMVSLFLKRPLDFSSFPTLLLLTTLLRLSLNVATTRLILSHGNEGPLAAGHVVAAFGGFLMGGDVVIGLILFSILLVVNFMFSTLDHLNPRQSRLYQALSHVLPFQPGFWRATPWLHPRDFEPCPTHRPNTPPRVARKR
jgi:flagellar biosynthesis protein FlhA